MRRSETQYPKKASIPCWFLHTVRVKSGGGGAKKIVVTENAETQTSTVKFTLLTEDSAIKTVRGWLQLRDANRIEIVEQGITRTFTQAIITNNPENAIGESGEIPLEWVSQAAV